MTDPTAHGSFGSALSCNLEPPPVALAIGAHPDDVDFGCGATLAKWAANGCSVHYLVCTDGSKGSWNPGQDPAALIASRQAEQREAARVITGRDQVTFLGEVDGELGSAMELRARVAFEIRRVRPDVLLGHDPWKRYRLHPDHRHAGFLTTDGLVAARDPHFFPDQGLDAHRPGALLLWEADEPDHLEDTTGFESVKLRALMCHRSQLESTMHIRDPGDRRQVDAFAEKLRNRQAAAGAPLGLTAAEAFKLLTDL